MENGLVFVTYIKSPFEDSVQAANEWGSDDDSVLESDRAYNSPPSIFESSPFTSMSNSNRADVVQQKRSLESDHSCRGRQSDHRYSDSELSDVLDTDARDVRECSSVVWKDRLRSADSVFSVVGSRKHRVDLAITLALPGKGALPSRGDLGGSYTHSVCLSHPLANSIFVERRELPGAV